MAIKKTSKNNRAKTGVVNLDKLIGGFKKNSVNLVAGGAGSGKTILSFQFLMEGLKNGESCIYVTFEEKKKKAYSDLVPFGWDFESYEKKGKFVFLEYTPEQVKRLITEGGGEIEEIIEDIKATRIVIDSISSFALLYQSELMRKEAALALFELINQWGCTALLTSQAIEKDSISADSELGFEVDSIIILYHTKKKGVRFRGLEVLKMRSTKIPEKTFPMGITNKGIEIDTKRAIEV